MLPRELPDALQMFSYYCHYYDYYYYYSYYYCYYYYYYYYSMIALPVIPPP